MLSDTNRIPPILGGIFAFLRVQKAHTTDGCVFFIKQTRVDFIKFASVENNRTLCYYVNEESAFGILYVGGKLVDIMMIGKNIAELRKAKGVKQDDVARFVGVTAQAVSKWENGGVPDTELLPKIAEFFNVSIDELFGMQGRARVDIQDIILEDITQTKSEERMERAFELCWMIEQGMYGTILSDSEQLKADGKAHGPNDQVYSQWLVDTGYTEMGLFNRMRYFLVVPDAPDKDVALLNGIDYPAFFKLMADPDVFNTLVFLYKRESENAFTYDLLTRELHLTQEKAKEIIAALLQIKILGRQTAEVGGDLVVFYDFRARPSFISMLIFAREMIDTPSNFYVNCSYRRKPYL